MKPMSDGGVIRDSEARDNRHRDNGGHDQGRQIIHSDLQYTTHALEDTSSLFLI